MEIHIFRLAPLILGHLADHSCTDNEVFSKNLAIAEKILVTKNYAKMRFYSLYALRKENWIVLKMLLSVME